MGLAELFLGSTNPIAQFIGANSNKIHGAFAGFGTQPGLGGGLAQAALYANQGGQIDDANAQRIAEDKARQDQIAKEIDYLRSSNPKLAEMVAAGMDPNAAFTQLLDSMKPPSPGDQFTLGPGETRYGPDGKVIAAGPAKPATASAPDVQTRFNPETGREEKVVWNAEKGDWEPFGGQKAAGGQGDLSATETKALLTSEDNIQAANNVISALDTALSLNDKSRSGFGASLGADIGNNLPDWLPGGGNTDIDTNTQQLKNIVTEQALSQLKLIFGGNPTEGERQILLDIQGSVDQPQQTRKVIFERAKTLAVARLKFNEERRQRLLSGGYGSVQTAPTALPGKTGGDNDPLGIR